MSSIKSAERVLALFEFFSGYQRPASISEIGDALNMPQSSTSMLVKNLLELGYLEKHKSGRTYFPTLRIALLGDWITRNTRDTGPIVDLLDEICKEIEETVILAMRNDMFAQYVLVQDPGSPFHLHVRSGMMRPLTRCSPGLIFLSHLKDEEVGRITRRINANLKENELKTEEAKILSQVHDTRKNRYAESRGLMTQGAGTISVAVYTPFTDNPMAVSVGGLQESIDEKRQDILNALRKMQRKIKSQKAQSDIERITFDDRDRYRNLHTNFMK